MLPYRQPSGGDGNVKRVPLCVMTNVAVLAVLSMTLRVFGIEQMLVGQGAGFNLTGLIVFAALLGMGGWFISPAMSKRMALRSTAARVIDQPADRTERGYGPGFWAATIAAQLLLGILASMIVRWFSRWGEFRADAGVCAWRAVEIGSLRCSACMRVQSRRASRRRWALSVSEQVLAAASADC